MHSMQANTRSRVSRHFANTGQNESVATEDLVEQLMDDAVNQLTAITGLKPSQVIEMLTNRYSGQHIQRQSHKNRQLLNDDESIFIGNLFN